MICGVTTLDRIHCERIELNWDSLLRRCEQVVDPLERERPPNYHRFYWGEVFHIPGESKLVNRESSRSLLEDSFHPRRTQAVNIFGPRDPANQAREFFVWLYSWAGLDWITCT